MHGPKRWRTRSSSSRTPSGTTVTANARSLAFDSSASDFVALGAGELDSALEKYKAATENDPRLAAAFNDLGVLLHAQVSSS